MNHICSILRTILVADFACWRTLEISEGSQVGIQICSSPSSNNNRSNNNSNSNSNDDNDKKKATDKTKTYRNKIGKHDEKCTATIARSKGKTFKNPKQKVDLQLQNIANAAQQGLD